MAEEQKETNEDFKNKVKQWLHVNRYDYKWLAGQIGLAVGTVRNWFYTDAPITAGNQRRISAIIADNDLTRGATRGADAPACLSFRKFKNGDNLDMLPQAFGNGVVKADFSAMAAAVEDEAAPCAYMNKAAWVASKLTDMLNEEAERIIRNHIAGVKDKSAIKLSDFARAEMHVADSSIPADAPPQIPCVQVIEESFQLAYAKIAAKLEGFDTVEEWIGAFIDKIAEDAFLSDFGLKEPEYKAKGITIVTQHSSDDI